MSVGYRLFLVAKFYQKFIGKVFVAETEEFLVGAASPCQDERVGQVWRILVDPVDGLC